MRLFLVGVLLVMSSAAAEASEAAASASGYVDLPLVTVPIIDDYRTLGHLQARLAVAADDPVTRATLVARQPRLVDAYLRALAEFARVRVDPSRPVNVGRLRATLQAETQRLAPGRRVRLLVLDATVRRS